AHFAQDAALPFPRLPHFPPLAGGGVSDPNRPRFVGAARAQNALAFMARLAHKGDRTAGRRPRRVAVPIRTRGETTQQLAGPVIASDEPVIAAVADEAKVSPVRRPLRALGSAACLKGLGRRRLAV